MSVKNKFERGKVMTENRPIHTLSYGTTKITIWQNDNSELGKFFNLGIHRVFTREGKWERSSYFSEYDIPILSKAILDAHTWIENYKKPDAMAFTLPAARNDEETEEPEQ